MQITKRLYTTLIITVLTISTILVAIPMASAAVTAVNLDVATGPVGTEVAVTGSASPFGTVTLYWDNLAGQVLGTGPVDAAGAFDIDVTIPSATTGTHYIVANDGGGALGASFDVTASLSTDVTRALPGDPVVLTGHGFAADSEITVTLDSTTLGTPVSITLTSPTITTNGTGSFSATITIPSSIDVADYDTYDVTAEDEDTTTATTQIIIDYYVMLTPSTGPTGITTTISGRIPANTEYQLRFNGAAIASGTSAADGAFSDTYTIPGVLSPNPYTVEVVWETTNTRTATFTVTSPPSITLGATSGVAGTVVTITGTGFSDDASITLTFDGVTVNSTDMDDRFGPTDATGAFDLEFTVPAIAPATYAVTVQDQYGAANAAGTFFTVEPTPTTTVVLRGTSYYRGDTLSFNIVTTEQDAAPLGTITVTINDPSGVTWWTTTAWTLPTTGVTRRLMYQDQVINGNPLTLPADAPLGSWNWTITYTPSSTATATKATALFTVAELPSQQAVLDRLDEIETVITTTEGDIIAVINTQSGQIKTNIDALNPQLQAITDTAVIIATDVGEVKTAIADLDMGTLGADITSIKNGMATIQTNIGTVSTAVSALDAKVTSVQGDVATVQTTLGTLQGTITSIDGNVATIETDVGTLQADLTNVGSDVNAINVDMTPAWIAVVLSLIAAIAAIFAVITIRQKIAG